MVSRDLTRFHHMLDCARAISKFSIGKTREDLDTDRIFSSAIIREFEVLGEAASAISIQTRSQFLEIPWKKVVGMRNQLIHAYFDIDHDIVWRTIMDALPDLIKKIESAISDLQSESPLSESYNK